jgi:hypothetical protein
MGYQHKKPKLIRANFATRRERLLEESETITLKDMPLETRRKEANKPLFLIRYE